MAPEEEKDIVLVILRRCMVVSPEFSQDMAKAVEREMREKYGGQRVFVPKGAQKRLSPEERDAAYRAGLTNQPSPEIQSSHGISRATLYRLMKKGPGRP